MIQPSECNFLEDDNMSYSPESKYGLMLLAITDYVLKNKQLSFFEKFREGKHFSFVSVFCHEEADNKEKEG